MKNNTINFWFIWWCNFNRIYGNVGMKFSTKSRVYFWWYRRNNSKNCWNCCSNNNSDWSTKILLGWKFTWNYFDKSATIVFGVLSPYVFSSKYSGLEKTALSTFSKIISAGFLEISPVFREQFRKLRWKYCWNFLPGFTVRTSKNYEKKTVFIK